jgi:hypothetical protein
MNTKRYQAAEAFARSLRTGELAASRLVADHLAEDVVLAGMGPEVRGRAKVLERITGQWPMTPALGRGNWSTPQPEGDGLRITADFSALGAAPRDFSLTFGFDADDRIVLATQKSAFPSTPQKFDRIPDHVRSPIDRALANGTPLVLSYVDDLGYPSVSLRGSIQVYGDLQLCAWLRDANSGLVRAVNAGRPLGLLYRDSSTRSTFLIRARGRLDDDPAVREQVFNLAPEVEQTHDVARKGAALIIDVERITGTSPQGAILVEPPGS